MIGGTINNEESVPKITPTVITMTKSKIMLPPKRTRAMRTDNVVTDVIKVLLRVVFKAIFTISAKGFLRMIRTSSRILSKMMMVSLRE